MKYVEEDSIVSFLQEAASWGLDRVDQRYLPLDGEASFTGLFTSLHCLDY